MELRCVCSGAEETLGLTLELQVLELQFPRSSCVEKGRPQRFATVLTYRMLRLMNLTTQNTTFLKLNQKRMQPFTFFV